MLVDITEEEREFLIRVCTRAKLFSQMQLLSRITPSSREDLKKIDTLLKKLEKFQNAS
jgi:hypothetical protein